jgi:hypothetical protein
MDQQRRQFFFQGSTGLLGLAPSRRQRDDDVTEVAGGLMEAMRRPRLPVRKGQDVRAAIFASEQAVQISHSSVTHERDAHVRGRLANELEDGLRQSQDSPATDGHRPNMYLERNGH